MSSFHPNPNFLSTLSPSQRRPVLCEGLRGETKAQRMQNVEEGGDEGQLWPLEGPLTVGHLAASLGALQA